MCFILYGAVRGNIDNEIYEKISEKYDLSFKPGTKHDIKMCIKNEDDEFRVTRAECDCDTALGRNEANCEEIEQYSALFEELKEIEGIEHIYLSKTWTGKINKNEISVKVRETDMKNTLAGLKENCLYTFVF